MWVANKENKRIIKAMSGLQAVRVRVASEENKYIRKKRKGKKKKRSNIKIEGCLSVRVANKKNKHKIIIKAISRLQAVPVWVASEENKYIREERERERERGREREREKLIQD